MSMMEEKHGFTATFPTEKYENGTYHALRGENLTRSTKVLEEDSFYLKIANNAITEVGSKPSFIICLNRELFKNFYTKTCYTLQSDPV